MHSPLTAAIPCDFRDEPGLFPLFAQADQPEKQKIRMGQIGVGHAHASKLAVYCDSTDYEVVGIVEPDESFAGGLNRSRLFVTFPG